MNSIIGNAKICAAITMLFVFEQAVAAALEPTGRFEKDETERGGGTYFVGWEKILLSREDHRIYINAVAGDAVAQCEFAKIL